MSLGSLIGGGLGAVTGGASSAMVPAMSDITGFSLLPEGAGVFASAPIQDPITNAFSPMAALGGAAGSAQTGFKYGSLADQLLNPQSPPPEAPPPAPPKKPLLQSNPVSSWQTNQALSSIPPELQTKFSNLFQTGMM